MRRTTGKAPKQRSFCRLDIDIHRNRPNVHAHELTPQPEDDAEWHGTSIELYISGGWSTYKARITNYLQQLAVIARNAKIHTTARRVPPHVCHSRRHFESPLSKLLTPECVLTRTTSLARERCCAGTPSWSCATSASRTRHGPSRCATRGAPRRCASRRGRLSTTLPPWTTSSCSCCTPQHSAQLSRTHPKLWRAQTLNCTYPKQPPPQTEQDQGKKPPRLSAPRAVEHRPRSREATRGGAGAGRQ